MEKGQKRYLRGTDFAFALEWLSSLITDSSVNDQPPAKVSRATKSNTLCVCVVAPPLRLSLLKRCVCVLPLTHTLFCHSHTSVQQTAITSSLTHTHTHTLLPLTHVCPTDSHHLLSNLNTHSMSHQPSVVNATHTHTHTNTVYVYAYSRHPCNTLVYTHTCVRTLILRRIHR